MNNRVMQQLRNGGRQLFMKVYFVSCTGDRDSIHSTDSAAAAAAAEDSGVSGVELGSGTVNLGVMVEDSCNIIRQVRVCVSTCLCVCLATALCMHSVV